MKQEKKDKGESEVIMFRGTKRLKHALEKYAEQKESTVSRELRIAAKKLVGLK